MNKKEIYALLKSRDIWHEITEHQAVFTMEEAAKINLPYPDAEAKSLFVRDDKKRNYYLITVKGDKRIDLKDFKKKNLTRSLSFASENDLMQILNLIPGAVTPLGILNDVEHKVEAFIDEDFMKEEALIGIHPNDNTATVWMKTSDLIELLEEYGIKIRELQFENQRD